VLSSNLTAEANPRSVFTRNRFNFQRHRISESEAHSCECNEWAIHHSLKRCALELPLVLNFEEFLFAEENAVDWQIPAVESAGVGDLEPKFVDSQALDFSLERLRRER
jgi:hypothetical protein